MEQTIFVIIVLFIILDFLLERILSYLNAKSWTKNLPDQLKGLYDNEKYQKAQAYDKANTKLSLISSFFSLIIILTMLFIGGFAYVDQLAKSITANPILITLTFFGILFIASDLLGLPFSLYKTFVIEEKFGFNKMTVKTYVLDKIKGYALTIIIGGGLLTAFIWFYQNTGTTFWLYAWIIFSVFTLFFTMFYTTLIVPLFNKLTPLEESSLKNKIEAYARQVNFSLKNIFVINGSKRSSKANAYFSGIGNKKTIVLYDTLIKDHTEDELVAILAHEVGHYKKKHVFFSIALSILQMGLMLYVLSLFINEPVLSRALGAEQAEFHLGLLAFSLLYSPISTITGILMNLLSRKNEYEADEFAVKTTNGKALQEALKKLSTNHLSNLTPHPAYVFFHYSHPPLLKRLEAMERVRISN